MLEEEEDSEEISAESLQQLNALLEDGPGEDASEEEVEVFMKKFAETPGGSAMLKTLNQQLADGGGALLNEVLGQQLPSLVDGPDWSLYQAPKSPLRLVFRIQPIGAKVSYWRRVTLPTDASFYDLHFALQDAFEQFSTAPHRFEWCENERVEAVFLSGHAEVKGGDDYCEYQNRPLDLFSESVDRFFYYQDGAAIPAFIVLMEKVVEPNSFETPVAFGPCCIGGEGPEEGFEPSQVKFRLIERKRSQN